MKVEMILYVATVTVHFTDNFLNPIQHRGGPYGPYIVKIEHLYFLTFPKYSQEPFKANKKEYEKIKNYGGAKIKKYRPPL